ncbi:MAG: alpha-amylase family glycosyl hydrolase [Candidatus Methylomirabilota bacterium]
MSEGPRIYNLFPLLAGPLPRWRPHLERAAAMGFTWIFVNPFHESGFSGSLYSVKDYYHLDPRLQDGTGRPAEEQLRDMLGEAGKLGLAVMMDLVINHTAFDSPLLREHPDWYKRDEKGRIVHPGAKDGEQRVVWRDLAEVDNAGSADRHALWDYWRKLALHYAGLGFRGFRCDAAYQVPGALWRDLIGTVKARHPEVLFLAETLGCTPEQTLETAGAGFDFIFNSSKWWNFREAWCLEQYEKTAPVVPSISFPETHDTARLAVELDGDRQAVLQRYVFAATFSTGVMLPVGFEYGFQKRLHVVQTTPADWESPRWDLTGAIAAIHRTKAALRPLNEEGPLTPVDLGNHRLFAFVKRTRDGQEEALVAMNLDRAPAARFLPRTGLRAAHRLAFSDPLTAASRPSPGDAEVEVRPSGSLVVHHALDARRRTGIGAGEAGSRR